MGRCNKCDKELPADWNFARCPYCGEELTPEKPATMTGASLGDANAFAGDVSITSNVTQNITKIERDKSSHELKSEAEAQYRELCKAVIADGIVTQEEVNRLKDAQTRLGLSDSESAKIMTIVKAGAKRSSKSVLGKIQQVSLNQILKIMEAGKIENLAGALGRLEAMAEKYDADEVQCNYWMILCGLDSNKIIEKYQNRESDNYWQSFWTAMAYINTGINGAAESLISDLEAWNDMPFGNIALLAAANSLNEYWNDTDMSDFKEQAQAFVEEGGGESTDLIDKFAQALMILMDIEDYSQIEEFHEDFAFQLDFLLKGITDKIKMISVRNAIPEMPKTDLLPE